MTTIHIGNYKYRDNNTSGITFPVDRKTPVGNPFFMKNESERNKVCDQYEKWFNEQVKINTKMQKYLNEILDTLKYTDVTLMCWCSPKRCHAETIRNWLLNNRQS